MIFGHQLLAAVLAGEKTQTRRRVKDGETHCRYVRDHDYAIQAGRGHPGNGRIIVLREPRRERCGDISGPGVLAEGFLDRETFLQHIAQLWKVSRDAVEDIEVWVITFALARTD